VTRAAARATATIALACAALGCEARAADGGVGVSANPGGDLAAPPAVRVGVAIPLEWEPLPEVAAAGLAAVGEAARGRTVVRAWGTPSLGCYATVVELVAARGEHAPRVAETFRATLALGAQVDDWTYTDGAPAEARASIVRGAMRGAVRGRIATGTDGVPHGAFAACFYNERDPARCQAACAGLLASLEAPKVSP